MGTISVLDALRKCARPCTVIIVSTDKCYQNKEWDYGYRETDRLGGHDPYSASKAAMEIAVASYCQAYFSDETAGDGVRVSTVRAGNVIGGGDWAKDRIVPDAVRALAEDRALRVRNPSSVRPWQHVLEPLSGYLWLAARMSMTGGGQFASSWNFGPPSTQRQNLITKQGC
jgi:CDP-glucose 4,6-dehydratase